MQELFPPLPKSIRDALQDFPKVLQSVIPMQAKHRHLLPQAIEELSTRLTSERGLLQQPYWSAPRFTSAYAWYFLPWNIIRLTRLLHGLELPPPTPMPVKKDGPALPRIFADMGSGPLSLPIALWLAKPQWRSLPLTVVCTDISPHPLATGQKIFEALAGKDSPWRIVTRRCHLEGTASEIYKTEGVPWLVTAANVCNELKGRQDQTTEDRLEEVVSKLLGTLSAPDARLLFVEPGTRLGGKTIVSLREVAQNYDLMPVSPCAHGHECPLDDTRTWCHFTFDIQGAPHWLTELSMQANLRKDALSLSFVLLQNYERTEEEAPPAQGNKARIISAPFRVPGVVGSARYACAPQGLTLLSRAQNLPSGALVEIVPPTEHTKTDRKSGAFMVDHKENVGEIERYYSSQRDGYHERSSRDYSHERRPYAPATSRDGRNAPRSSYNDRNEGSRYGRDERRYADEGSRYGREDGRYANDSRNKPEKKKKVIKPSKKNEKKFWEK